MRETTVEASQFQRGTSLPAWYQRRTELPISESSEPTILRRADTHFRVETPATVVVQRAIQVNDPAAIPEVGQYPIEFNPDYQRVELHWLKVHRGTETIDKLGTATVRFYHAERTAEQGIYSGTKTAVVIPTDIRTGDTLEIIYSLIGQNPVYGGQYTELASWDNGIPTLARRVTLDLPKGRKIRHRVIGGNGGTAPVPVELDLGDRHVVRYEADHLPPVEGEAMVPPDVHMARSIQFSEFRSWNDVARWANQLFQVKTASPLVLPPELAAAPTKAETVMRTLQFVQEEIRYLSISIGENSHRPSPPTEVMGRRYGDCKDKTLLMVTVLRQLGIQAEPVLLGTYMRKGLREFLASPAMFNHAIVRVTLDGQHYYLDPTLQAQGSRLDRLGRIFPGTEALVIREDTREPELIPLPPVDAGVSSQRIERVQTSRLDEPVTMDLIFSYEAEEAEAVRRVLRRLSATQLRKIYEGLLDRRYPQASLLGDPQVRDDRDKNVLVIEARYKIQQFFEKQDTKWSFRYEASNLIDVLPSPNSAKRRFPLHSPAFPWSARYSLEVLLPDDYDGRYQPELRSLEGEAFKLSDVLRFQGRQISTEVNLSLSKDRISAAGTPQFLEDLRKAGTFLRGTLFVQEQDRLLPTTRVSLKEASRQRLDQALQNSESAIIAARSAGRETATPRCEHALAAAYLDRLDIARADSETAVSEQPTSPDALHCRGTVRFISGDFEGAIRDLTRSLALGEREPDLYFHRGLARYFAGQWIPSVEDFAAYGANTSDERGKARAVIWGALATQRAGRPIVTMEAPTAAWPAPVLSVIKHKVGADDVIEELNRREAGQKLDDALAEGYFYFSQHFATSNRVRAQAYLKRALDLGPLYSLIQVAARHETRRINAEVR